MLNIKNSNYPDQTFKIYEDDTPYAIRREKIVLVVKDFSAALAKSQGQEFLNNMSLFNLIELYNHLSTGPLIGWHEDVSQTELIQKLSEDNYDRIGFRQKLALLEMLAVAIKSKP